MAAKWHNTSCSQGSKLTTGKSATCKSQLPPEGKVGSKELLPGNSSVEANVFEILANFY